MKLNAALEYEKLRNEAASWNQIIIHKEGKFYHIYEWSAWLVKTIVCTDEMQQQRGDAKPLAATRYKAKEKIYAMVGFPVDSFGKFIPEYLNVENMPDDENTIRVTIDTSLMGEDATFETLNAEFEAWKDALPMKQKEQASVKHITNGGDTAPALARSGLFAIVASIMAYPVERKTPADNIEFISSIKQQVASML